MKTNNLHTGETHYMCRSIVKERDTLAQRVKELEVDKRELVEVLKYYRDSYSGAEPSVSVFDRKVFAALAKQKGEG